MRNDVNQRVHHSGTDKAWLLGFSFCSQIECHDTIDLLLQWIKSLEDLCNCHRHLFFRHPCIPRLELLHELLCRHRFPHQIPTDSILSYSLGTEMKEIKARTKIRRTCFIPMETELRLDLDKSNGIKGQLTLNFI